MKVITQWLMLLKDKFNVTHSSPRNKRHGLPGRAAGGILDLGRETEAEARGEPRPEGSMGVSWQRQGKAG